MKPDVFYGVIIKKDGVMQINSLADRESAVIASQKLIKTAKDYKVKNLEIYFLEIDYDEYRKKVLSDTLVNKESKLIYNS